MTAVYGPCEIHELKGHVEVINTETTAAFPISIGPEHSIEALVDTGAHISVVSVKFMDQLQATIQLLCVCITKDIGNHSNTLT